MAFPEYANKQESLSKYSGPSKSDPFYWQGRGRTPIGTPGPMPSWAGNVVTGAQQHAVEQGSWRPTGSSVQPDTSSTNENHNNDWSSAGTTAPSSQNSTVENEDKNQSDQGLSGADQFHQLSRQRKQAAKEEDKDGWSISDVTVQNIKKDEMAPEQYTLSGQPLADDDYAGIAMSKYLSGNQKLSSKYGDNWGKLQGEGTYDEWQDVLSDPGLAVYFTNITGDERFQGDNGFDFDKYWEYTNSLNPQNIASYDYDDFKLLNGTSAGGLYSFYDYVSPDNESGTPGYKYRIDTDGYAFDNGRVVDPEGNEVFRMGEDGKLYDMYNRWAPINYNYNVDMEDAEDFLHGLTHSEYTNLLLASALANSVDLGVDKNLFSEDELAFLNGLELNSPYLNIENAANSAAGATLYGNPLGVDYAQMLDQDVDFFGEYNPYMADYRVLTNVGDYPSEMLEAEYNVKSGKDSSPGVLDNAFNFLNGLLTSAKDDTK